MKNNGKECNHMITVVYCNWFNDKKKKRMERWKGHKINIKYECEKK